MSGKIDRRKLKSSRVYILLLVAGLVARLVLIANRPFFEHDDAISLLAATGHQGAYAAGPVDQWVRAAEWQRFIQPDRAFIFGRIASDLARTDSHPPLYFWLLHVWVTITGVTPWSGPLLNVLLDLVILWALFRLGRDTLGSSESALAASALWLLSPIAIRTTLPTRQYDLFTLWAVLFAWGIVRYTSGQRRALVWITITACAGLLTHYYFVLALGAGVAVVWWTQRHRYVPPSVANSAGHMGPALRPTVNVRLSRLALSLGIAVALAVALHPTFYRSFEREASGGFAVGELGERIAVVIGALILLALPVGFALAGAALGRIVSPARPLTYPSLPVIPLFAAALVGGQIALYLAQVSPVHALMDARYLGPAWPFIALGLARVGQRRAACVGMLILAALTTFPVHPPSRTIPAAPLVSDNPAAGVWLPVVYHLAPDTPVFVADQADLLADAPRWIDPLVDAGGFFDSVVRYDATDPGRAALLDRLPAAVAPTRFIWQSDPHRDADEVIYRVGLED